MSANPKPTLLSKARLIEACDIVIEREKTAWQESRDRYFEAVEKRTKDWVEKYNDRWGEAANAIKRAVKKGEPVTAAILPGSKNNQVEVFRPDSQVYIDGRWKGEPPKEFRATAEIVMLKNALFVHTEDDITPNGLKSLGVTDDARRRAIQVMGEHEIERAKTS